jgi:hypothetical protein
MYIDVSLKHPDVTSRAILRREVANGDPDQKSCRHNDLR